MTGITASMNIHIKSSDLTNGKLTESNLISAIARDGGMSNADASTALLAGNLSLQLTIDSGDGSAVELDLDAAGIDIDHLTINDNNDSDLTVYVADSDGITVQRNVSTNVTTDGATAKVGGLHFHNDSTAAGTADVENDITATLATVTAATTNTYTIDNSDIDATGGNVSIGSSIELKQTSGTGDNVAQSDANGNLNAITAVKFNIKGNSNYSTDIDYSNVSYNDTINADTSSLGNMAAGVEVYINQTGGAFDTEGDVAVNASSTLGDTQATAFINQLTNWTLPSGDYLVDDSDGSTITNDQIISGLKGSDSATWLAKLQKGQISDCNGTAGVWHDGNAPGDCHLSMTFTTDPTKATYSSSNPSNTGDLVCYLPQSEMDKLGITAGTKYYGDDKGLAGTAPLTQAMRNAMVGYQDAGNLIKTPIKIVAGDDYRLNISSANSTDTTTQAYGTSGCRYCDPVAMVHIVSLGTAGSSSGNLFVSTTNTAELRDFVGSTTVDSTDGSNGKAGTASSSLTTNGFQFRTGLDFVDNNGTGRTASSAEANEITAQVGLKIQADGTQKGRDTINMVGGIYDQAGHRTDSSSYSQVSGLTMGSGYANNALDQGTIYPLVAYLNSHSSMRMDDPSTWDSTFLGLLEGTSGGDLNRSLVMGVIENYVGSVTGTGSTHLTAAQAAQVDDKTLHDHTGYIDGALMQLGYGMSSDTTTTLNFVYNLNVSKQDVIGQMAHIGSAATISTYENKMETDGSVSLAENLVDDTIADTSKTGAAIATVVVGIKNATVMDDALTHVEALDPSSQKFTDVATGLGHNFTSSNSTLVNGVMTQLGSGTSADGLMNKMLSTDSTSFGNIKAVFDADLSQGGAAAQTVTNYVFRNIGSGSDKVGVDAYLVSDLLSGSSKLASVMTDKLRDALLNGRVTSSNSFVGFCNFAGGSGAGAIASLIGTSMSAYPNGITSNDVTTGITTFKTQTALSAALDDKDTGSTTADGVFHQILAGDSDSLTTKDPATLQRNANEMISALATAISTFLGVTLNDSQLKDLWYAGSQGASAFKAQMATDGITISDPQASTLSAVAAKCWNLYHVVNSEVINNPGNSSTSLCADAVSNASTVINQ